VIIPDVNLLLYSVVSAFPRHKAAHAWWEEAINSATEIGLASPAIFGFIRVATNPRVLSPPLTVEAATGYVSAWLGQPNVSYLVPGPRHIEIAFNLLHTVGTGGNLTTDAQLAALALEYEADIFSNDTDFTRFSGLRWVNPLARADEHSLRSTGSPR
jgi:toxin-antitoxin system PIN domain toxin